MDNLIKMLIKTVEMQHSMSIAIIEYNTQFMKSFLHEIDKSQPDMDSFYSGVIPKPTKSKRRQS